jgi:hypothetical protein
MVNEVAILLAGQKILEDLGYVGTVELKQGNNSVFVSTPWIPTYDGENRKILVAIQLAMMRYNVARMEEYPDHGPFLGMFSPLGGGDEVKAFVTFDMIPDEPNKYNISVTGSVCRHNHTHEFVSTGIRQGWETPSTESSCAGACAQSGVDQ